MKNSKAKPLAEYYLQKYLAAKTPESAAHYLNRADMANGLNLMQSSNPTVKKVGLRDFLSAKARRLPM